MRILLVTGSLPPMRCGVGEYTALLAHTLGERKDATVAVLTDVSAKSAPVDPNYKLMPIVNGWKFSDIPAIVRAIRGWNPDIVHIQYPTQGYIGKRLPYFLPLIAKLMNVAVVQTLHEFLLTTRSLTLLFNVLATNAIVVVRPNYKSTVAPFYRFLIPHKQFLHIPNASTIPTVRLQDSERSSIRSGFCDPSKGILAYFGFVYHHKGTDLLFEIADPALHHIVLICELNNSDEYHRKIMDFARLGKWAGNATITGYLAGENVGRILAAADAVVLPFRNGGGTWNTSIHGAMAQGTFVLTTSTERRGYDSSNNIYYALPGDVAEMREALNSYSGLRTSPGALATGWSPIAEMHLQLYRRLLGREIEGRL